MPKNVYTTNRQLDTFETSQCAALYLTSDYVATVSFSTEVCSADSLKYALPCCLTLAAVALLQVPSL